MKSPSFLCVHASQELYGSDRVFLQTLSALRAQWPDARITALLPGDGPLVQAAKKITGDVRIDDLFVLRRSRLKSLPRELPSLASRLFKARSWMEQYDVTYISTIVVLDFILASRLTRSPVIIHVHELPTGAARLILSFILKFSRAFLVFISKQSQNGFVWLSTKRQKIIWNGTRSLRLTSLESRPSSKLHVLLIGRFNAWKGQGLLIDAIALLPANRRASIKVRLVGSVFEGQERFHEDILLRIAEHELQEIVEVLPFDPEPGKYYAWASVVAVPSTQPEPFGLVAIEAMSAGRAVLAANHGGLSELVEDRITGELLPPGDAVAWRDALLRYLDDVSLATSHGQAGQQRFSRYFDESIYLREISLVASCELSRGRRH